MAGGPNNDSLLILSEIDGHRKFRILTSRDLWRPIFYPRLNNRELLIVSRTTHLHLIELWGHSCARLKCLHHRNVYWNGDRLHFRNRDTSWRFTALFLSKSIILVRPQLAHSFTILDALLFAVVWIIFPLDLHVTSIIFPWRIHAYWFCFPRDWFLGGWYISAGLNIGLDRKHLGGNRRIVSDASGYCRFRIKTILLDIFCRSW